MVAGKSMQVGIRNMISALGTSVSIYSYENATKTTNDEGEVTVSDWGSPTVVFAILGDNIDTFLRDIQIHLEQDANRSAMVVKDNVTIAGRDKVTLPTGDFIVNGIMKQYGSASNCIFQLVELSEQ